MEAFFISKALKAGKKTILEQEYEVFLEKILKLTFNHVFLEGLINYIMKQVHYFSLLLFLSVAVAFASCSDDDDKGNGVGITGHSWTVGKAVEISMEHSATVTFNASADWTASTKSTWCNLSATSGKTGANTLRLSVNSTSATDRTATITLTVAGYSPVNFEVTQKGSSQTVTEDMELNEQVNKYLREKYLWNDEYKTLELDFTKYYEDFFYDALGNMTTNTLDKRYDENNKPHLFSYILKKNSISSTRTYPSIKKELEYSFGVTGMTLVGLDHNGNYAYCIQGVYPDSPASHSGIKRGTYISEINGNKITENNYLPIASNLLSPENILTLKVTEFIINDNNTTGTKEFSMTSETMYKNPIIYQDVIETNTPHKIGYLVYAGFEAAYDAELFEVFKRFKSQNINELVLDLRYNGGGYTMSANLIASCIAGNAYKDAVFVKFRFNKERMEALGNKKVEEKSMYSYYQNLNTSLSAGDLSLKRVYCLVGNATASASELVINSLRGIGIDIVLIGEKTTGKNVGMEPTDITVGENTYEVVPITFQTYNAQDFGDYENGFIPEIPLSEDDANGDEYFDDYIDYGNLNEPLLSRAIQEITGQVPSNTRSVRMRGTIGKALKLPAVYRPGYGGMLKKFEE